jgi:hypothetical protein
VVLSKLPWQMLLVEIDGLLRRIMEREGLGEIPG